MKEYRWMSWQEKESNKEYILDLMRSNMLSDIVLDSLKYIGDYDITGCLGNYVRNGEFFEALILLHPALEEFLNLDCIIEIIRDSESMYRYIPVEKCIEILRDLILESIDWDIDVCKYNSEYTPQAAVETGRHYNDLSWKDKSDILEVVSAYFVGIRPDDKICRKFPEYTSSMWLPCDRELLNDLILNKDWLFVYKYINMAHSEDYDYALILDRITGEHTCGGVNFRYAKSKIIDFLESQIESDIAKDKRGYVDNNSNKRSFEDFMWDYCNQIVRKNE